MRPGRFIALLAATLWSAVPTSAEQTAISEVEATSIYVEQATDVARTACRNLAISRLAEDAWFEGVRRDYGVDVREWVDVGEHQQVVIAVGRKMKDRMYLDITKDAARSFCAQVYLDMGPDGRIAPRVVSVRE